MQWGALRRTPLLIVGFNLAAEKRDVITLFANGVDGKDSREMASDICANTYVLSKAWGFSHARGRCSVLRPDWNSPDSHAAGCRAIVRAIELLDFQNLYRRQ